MKQAPIKMLNTDSMRMYANLPPGFFGPPSTGPESLDGPHQMHHHHRTSHHGDYFASSSDFEYDLFLRGIVSCDPTEMVYRSGTTSATTNRKSMNSSSFLSRVTQRSSQRKKNYPTSHSNLFSSVTSLNRVTFDPFVPRPPRADSYDTFDSSHSIRFCNSSLSVREDEEEFFAKKHPSTTSSASAVLGRQQQNLQKFVIEEEEACESSGDLSAQQMHALHRFRRQKKKGIISKLRDAVISFSPRSRVSIIDRRDLYFRYGKEEKDALASFSFLENELRTCSLYDTVSHSLSPETEVDTILVENDLQDLYVCDCAPLEDALSDENNNQCCDVSEDAAVMAKKNSSTVSSVYGQPEAANVILPVQPPQLQHVQLQQQQSPRIAEEISNRDSLLNTSNPEQTLDNSVVVSNTEESVPRSRKDSQTSDCGSKNLSKNSQNNGNKKKSKQKSKSNKSRRF